MDNVYNTDMKPMKSNCGKYYVGTTHLGNPTWHNYEKKALMYLDLNDNVLHFEAYD